MKLTTSNTFRLYLIVKNDWEGGNGGLMEQYVSRSDRYLTDTGRPPLPIPELIYFFMKLIISMFQEAIKIDCLVLANYPNFY